MGMVTYRERAAQTGIPLGVTWDGKFQFAVALLCT